MPSVPPGSRGRPPQGYGYSMAASCATCCTYSPRRRLFHAMRRLPRLSRPPFARTPRLTSRNYSFGHRRCRSSWITSVDMPVTIAWLLVSWTKSSSRSGDATQKPSPRPWRRTTQPPCLRRACAATRRFRRTRYMSCAVPSGLGPPTTRRGSVPGASPTHRWPWPAWVQLVTTVCAWCCPCLCAARQLCSTSRARISSDPTGWACSWPRLRARVAAANTATCSEFSLRTSPRGRSSPAVVSFRTLP
mmetsp:Transcript_64700/g.180031  ORF Transcript_64700/g.180031 Transcript_64700/m.180031 type:complete len:246 (-) Transcript_64700:522-1259(-)